MQCKHCKIEFKRTRYNQKYCSSSCRNKYWGNKYYKKNRDSILARQQTDKYRQRQSLYNKTPKHRKWHREYIKQKRRTNPLYKLKENIYGRIKINFPQVRKAKLEEYLGYTIEDLWLYLISNSDCTTEDYLSKKAELDHIIPYHWFIVLTLGDEEFRKCWSMQNLRLISQIDNRNRRKKRWNWQILEDLGLVHLLPCGADVIYEKHCKSLEDQQ